jgi:hypothetical protein
MPAHGVTSFGRMFRWEGTIKDAVKIKDARCHMLCSRRPTFAVGYFYMCDDLGISVLFTDVNK